ncbi:Ubiquinone/menaquinone biosynthesis C-methyltransferase UbiE [uncultured archaeon]|nr:Ubiquinone/menaquinone biosynthesis C-methyltransferase UbiE [uncultured archaeon]
MVEDLKKLMIDSFGSEGAQKRYTMLAEGGLWDAEKLIINKYFKKKGVLLDLGCGTGRTTIPLQKMGFDVIGVDIVPEMIQTARELARSKGMKLNYRVGDATELKFKDNTFDYVLFSNQGWTHIPGRDDRQKALKEILRVLKKGGIFVFTTHKRTYSGEYIPFWIKQGVKQFILKPIGVKIKEIDFGDRFYFKESGDREITYKKSQYIHVPAVGEVIKEIIKSGFELVEVNSTLQPHNKTPLKYPPAFFVCKKR